MQGSKGKFISNELDGNVATKHQCDIAYLRLFKAGDSVDIGVSIGRLYDRFHGVLAG